jgi:predicted ATPase
MITRLQVDGFKNLVDIDLHFGPFTCIAGENGVGKSNIFDVLQFVSYLADYPVIEAVSKIRGGGEGQMNYNSISDIFRRTGASSSDKILIATEMIIPSKGVDELGQPARATGNYLRYELELSLAVDEMGRQVIKIDKEELIPITKKDASKRLLFPHAAKWRDKIIFNKRRSGSYISTGIFDGKTHINLHQDGGSSGRPNPFLADNMPRTILSTTRYASETPTVLLARREMQNWKFLQLEPSALRRPDDFDTLSSLIRVDSKGSNLPGTVFRLATSPEAKEEFGGAEGLYALLANSLSGLIPEVKEIRVDKDEKRRTLTLEVVNKDGTVFPARSLSDGTLRFLALSILDVDYTEDSLICLEEPENGIHPERIPIIISLLKDIPFDPFDIDTIDDLEVPLRQVIINTHSPGVVSEVPENSLVYVQQQLYVKKGQRFKGAVVLALPSTWRTKGSKAPSIKMGNLIAYLSPVKKTNKSNTVDGEVEKKVKDNSGVLELFELLEDYATSN